jgi:phage terminase large subunit-like protein
MDQIYAIKHMIESEEYQILWPEMINKRPNDRAKWAAEGFIVDHPLRKERGTRDWTIRVRTVKSNAIGLHCSHLLLDDVVIPEFAYTEIGRRDLSRRLSQYSSIKNPGAITKGVGTRYHTLDAYAAFAQAEVSRFDDGGIEEAREPLWEIMEESVEDAGDSTGNYLWPREKNADTGEWYGFDRNVLSVIKAQYQANGDIEQFWAQYYNDPNDPDSKRLQRSDFRYYDKKFLSCKNGVWYFKDRKLNVSAGMDVAWTVKGKSDYTAIAVIGVDHDGFIYILELDRFKTSDFDEYYNRVGDLHEYWFFKKIRVETNSGGQLVANEIENRVRQNGRTLVVEGKHTSGKEGNKFEKFAAVIEPRYKQGTILHYKGGLIQDLEEEVVLVRPPHDDLEDAVCGAIAIMKIPSKSEYGNGDARVVNAASRFGGRRRIR